MTLTRRDLIRSAAAVSGASLLARLGLADAAVAGTGAAAASTRSPRIPAGGTTTLDRVLAKGRAGRGGWRAVVERRGEPHRVRTDLGGTAAAERTTTREPLLVFAQLSDVHVVDSQSPMRLEIGDSDGATSGAYRPQEVLTAHIAEAMVREINAVGRGPVTGAPLALALQTGDNSDNGQYNEIRWNIDLLDGGRITPDSGDPTRYEGVMDGSKAYYSTKFWHPHGTPKGKPKDDYLATYGFPRVPGLLDACRAPFRAHGLDVAWITALGNHDQLMQGNFPHGLVSEATAVGDQKLTGAGSRTVTSDPDRRLLDRAETVAEHFTTRGLPAGHGFTEANRAAGTAYYTYDQGPVRFVVLDSVNANGGADGSLDPEQFAWLRDQLDAAGERLVVVASHHTSWTMNNLAVGTASPGVRVLGDQVVAELLAHDQVVAWVNGHTHRNQVRAHTREDGGGFWEINTASHIDWPQQSRIIEIVDNHDATLSIITTMLDHGAPLTLGKHLERPMRLAALGRLLAANDPDERTDQRRGTGDDRNVELLLPAPSFLR